MNAATDQTVHQLPVTLLRRASPLQSAELPEKVTVTLTLEKSKMEKLHAFMASETWDEAERVRKLKLEECAESLEHCVNWALKHDGGGAQTFAYFLASLYNGTRVKVDASWIGRLDSANFEHLMNVFRLCFETHREPHTFFAKGNDIFEKIIGDWKMEKRRRKS